MGDNREKCMGWSAELVMQSQESYYGVYFASCFATREINTKITLKWVYKQLATTVHRLFYFLYDMINTYLRMLRWFSHMIPYVTHSVHVQLMKSQLIADITNAIPDATIVTQACKKWYLGNLLDINFNNGYIHGWLCKKWIQGNFHVIHFYLTDWLTHGDAAINIIFKLIVVIDRGIFKEK